MLKVRSRIFEVILFLVTLPANALGLLLSIPRWSQSRFAFRVYRGALWLWCPELSVDGRTLGPNVIQLRDLEAMSPGHHIVDHELAHSEQGQGASLLGVLASVILVVDERPVWFAILPAIVMWLATAGASYVVAFLRGENTYIGASIEEAARAAERQ